MKIRNLVELIDELNTAKQELIEDDNEMSEIIGDTLSTLDLILRTVPELKQYRALVVNEENHNKYEAFVFAKDEGQADKAVHAIFDDYFYHVETGEQDMYSHKVEEVSMQSVINSFPCEDVELFEVLPLFHPS